MRPDPPERIGADLWSAFKWFSDRTLWEIQYQPIVWAVFVLLVIASLAITAWLFIYATSASRRNDDERPNKVGYGCIGWALMLFVLVLLYVLSIGPAVRLRTRGVITHETLVTVYFPISWLERKSAAFAYPIESYCDLWAGPPSQQP